MTDRTGESVRNAAEDAVRAAAKDGARDATATRKRNSAQSRELLLVAATELFSERGYEGTTIREVGVRAGVDAALIARYFGSKAQLFREAVVDPLVLVLEMEKRKGDHEKKIHIKREQTKTMASARPMVQRLIAAKPITAPLRQQARNFATTLQRSSTATMPARHEVSGVTSAQLAWLTAGTTLVVAGGIYNTLNGERHAIGHSFERRDARNERILAAIRDEAPLVGRPEDLYYPARA